MHEKLHFFPPVTISKDGNDVCLENIDQALSHLRSIPHCARDEKWVCALRCCEFARDDLMSVDSAKRSIEIWASERLSVNSRARVNTALPQSTLAVV